MEKKGVGWRAAERILGGPIPFASQNGVFRDEWEDVNVMDIVNRGRPFEKEQPKHEGPQPAVKYVNGNTVRGKNLGWTTYATNEIEIPTFDDVVRQADSQSKQMYEMARSSIQDYILGHELEVEVAHRPQNEQEHGFWEAQYLAGIEGTNAYMAGLALHKTRMEEGSGKQKEFSKQTGKIYDFKKAFKRYGSDLDEWMGMVSDVVSGKPTYPHQSGDAMQDYSPNGTGIAGRIGPARTDYAEAA